MHLQILMRKKELKLNKTKKTKIVIGRSYLWYRLCIWGRAGDLELSLVGLQTRRLLYWIYFADQLELFVYVPLDMKRTNLRFESDFKGVCLLRSALILLLNTEYDLLTFA